MRGFTYAVAAIAAVGIMIAIATMPQDDATDTAAAPATADVAAKTAAPDAETTAVKAQPNAASHTLTLAVPKMHCQFACFPKVKEALEADEHVEVVELGPQPEDAWNAQVVVTVKPGFNVENALAKLSESGYPESSVVE